MLNSYRPCSVITVWHSWSCPHVKQLQTQFSDYCLTQLICDPTRCHGHILDWIVLSENNGSVSQCRVLSTSFSDHNAIAGLNALNNSLTHCRVVSSKNLRKINSAKTQADSLSTLNSVIAQTLSLQTDTVQTFAAFWTNILHWPAESEQPAARLNQKDLATQ